MKTKANAKANASQNADRLRRLVRLSAHQKGWISGAVWGVAEVLRTHGEEVVARDMLKGLGSLDELRKHAEPCDIEEIEKHPWVCKPNAQRGDNSLSQ